MLVRDLPGYEDYCQKVKYRLIPNISPSHMLKEKQFIAFNKDLKQAIF